MRKKRRWISVPHSFMSDKEKKPISKAKKIYNIASTVIVALVFVFLVAMIGFVLYQRSHGNEVSIFGYYMFDVISDSMEPTINVGEVIISKKVDDVNALDVGDVITFTAPSGVFKGKNITHRIVEVARNDDGTVKYFRTKGDNPSVGTDSWQLAPSEVKAKFEKTSPFISGFRRFISHWYGYVILIVIPLLLVGVLLIVGYVRDRAEAIKNEGQAAVSVGDLTDEQKRKLLEEYLSDSDDNGATGANSSDDGATGANISDMSKGDSSIGEDPPDKK